MKKIEGESSLLAPRKEVHASSTLMLLALIAAGIGVAGNSIRQLTRGGLKK